MVSAYTAEQYLQNIHGAAGPQPASVEHVRGDPRRCDVLVAETLLPACASHADRHGPDVGARFQEMGGEAMPDRVASGRCRDAGRAAATPWREASRPGLYRGTVASHPGTRRRRGARCWRGDGAAPGLAAAGGPSRSLDSGPEGCPWPIPSILLRRVSRGGATDRRVLLTAAACQARRLRGGRRMRGPARRSRCGSLAPRGQHVLTWRGCTECPAESASARVCLARGRVVSDYAWMEQGR